MSLSVSYYTTNRTGGLYTNEHQKNDFLASHLVKSFTESVGYRQIFKNSNSCELPCTENDFYGYKRKALHEFDLLVKTVDL